MRHGGNNRSKSDCWVWLSASTNKNGEKMSVYQEAVEFRNKVESGEISDKGYVSIPSFLGVLGYMEQELLV